MVAFSFAKTRLHSRSALLAVFIFFSGLLAGLPETRAATLDVEIELPVLPANEYHPPYVVVWIEDMDNRAVATLSVWYDRDDVGVLPNLLQW